jgi:hypothetical protein
MATTRKLALPLLLLFCSCELASSRILPTHRFTGAKAAAKKNFAWAINVPGIPLSSRSSAYGCSYPSLYLMPLNSVKGEEGLNGDASPAKASSDTSSLAITLASIIGTTSSWCIMATLALSSHPTMTLAFRHNVLTIAHALAFPLPVLMATFVALHQTKDERTTRRLSLGVATASLWTAAAVFWCPTFSVGYDLFSNEIRYGCAAVYVATAATALLKWRRATVGTNHGVSRLVRGCVGSFFSLLAPRTATDASIDDPNNKNNSCLYAASSLGLLLLAILPQLVGFPTATIPALLGKRLSRAASGFTFLGAVAAYCLKDASERSTTTTTAANNTLRRGLFVGALGHLGLLLAKVIGVDGGGLLLPGRGLWELYPSLMKASGAATLLMVVTYSVLAVGTCPCGSSTSKDEELINGI